MTHPKEPPRLIDDASGASEALREVIRAGQGDLPSAAQVARLRARLPIAPPSPPATPAPPPAVSASAAGSVIPSALVGAALAVVVLVGGEVRDRRTTPKVEVAPATPMITAPTATAAAVETHEKKAVSPALPASLPAATIAPASPVMNAPSFAPSAARASDEAPALIENTPIGGGVAPAQIEAESEVRMLQRAQDALASDPSRALAIAGEHAQRFPGGALAQEREFLAISALSRMGRRGDARDRATRFLTAFPRSAYRARIESLVGIESVQKNEEAPPPTR